MPDPASRCGSKVPGCASSSATDPGLPPGRPPPSWPTAATGSRCSHPIPLCLARFTRQVHRVRRVPAYGADPLRWLAAALRIYQETAADVLFPTQEQVAVLSACPALLRSAGVRTAVPPFTALARVQDKISANGTLAAAGLPQPEGAVLATPEEVTGWDRFPVFMKLPVATASTGVRRVTGGQQLAAFAAGAKAAGAFGDGGVLAQLPAEGPLVMAQAVFAAGELVASHTCLRVAEGAGGGASHKRSVDLPVVRGHLERLGRRLGWHGALSADAILAGDGPRYIDINPRLVEPGNARRAGVDLVTPMLEPGRRRHARGPAARPRGRGDPSAADRRPRRGPADRAAGAGPRGTAGRGPSPRGLPGQYRGADPAPRRPAGRHAAGHGRRGDPGPARQLALVRRRQRAQLCAGPGRLAPAAARQQVS